MDETRLFFVVDSFERNPEIHETLGAALEDFRQLKTQTEIEPDRDHPFANGARLCVAMVKHAYREPKTKEWNYEDLADTFQVIKELQQN